MRSKPAHAINRQARSYGFTDMGRSTACPCFCRAVSVIANAPPTEPAPISDQWRWARCFWPEKKALPTKVKTRPCTS